MELSFLRVDVSKRVALSFSIYKLSLSRAYDSKQREPVTASAGEGVHGGRCVLR